VDTFQITGEASWPPPDGLGTGQTLVPLTQQSTCLLCGGVVTGALPGASVILLDPDHGFCSRICEDEFVEQADFGEGTDDEPNEVGL
jgi:hypothetical protein